MFLYSLFVLCWIDCLLIKSSKVCSVKFQSTLPNSLTWPNAFVGSRGVIKKDRGMVNGKQGVMKMVFYVEGKAH